MTWGQWFGATASQEQASNNVGGNSTNKNPSVANLLRQASPFVTTVVGKKPPAPPPIPSRSSHVRGNPPTPQRSRALSHSPPRPKAKPRVSPNKRTARSPSPGNRYISQYQRKLQQQQQQQQQHQQQQQDEQSKDKPDNNTQRQDGTMNEAQSNENNNNDVQLVDTKEKGMMKCMDELGPSQHTGGIFDSNRFGQDNNGNDDDSHNHEMTNEELLELLEKNGISPTISVAAESMHVSTMSFGGDDSFLLDLISQKAQLEKDYKAIAIEDAMELYEKAKQDQKLTANNQLFSDILTFVTKKAAVEMADRNSFLDKCIEEALRRKNLGKNESDDEDEDKLDQQNEHEEDEEDHKKSTKSDEASNYSFHESLASMSDHENDEKGDDKDKDDDSDSNGAYDGLLDTTSLRNETEASATAFALSPGFLSESAHAAEDRRLDRSLAILLSCDDLSAASTTARTNDDVEQSLLLLSTCGYSSSNQQAHKKNYGHENDNTTLPCIETPDKEEEEANEGKENEEKTDDKKEGEENKADQEKNNNNDTPSLDCGNNMTDCSNTVQTEEISDGSSSTNWKHDEKSRNDETDVTIEQLNYDCPSSRLLDDTKVILSAGDERKDREKTNESRREFEDEEEELMNLLEKKYNGEDFDRSRLCQLDLLARDRRGEFLTDDERAIVKSLQNQEDILASHDDLRSNNRSRKNISDQSFSWMHSCKSLSCKIDEESSMDFSKIMESEETFQSLASRKTFSWKRDNRHGSLLRNALDHGSKKLFDDDDDDDDNDPSYSATDEDELMKLLEKKFNGENYCQSRLHHLQLAARERRGSFLLDEEVKELDCFKKDRQDRQERDRLRERQERGEKINTDRLRELDLLIRQKDNQEKLSEKELLELKRFKKKHQDERYKREYDALIDRRKKGERINEDRLYHLELYVESRAGKRLTDLEANDLKLFLTNDNVNKST